MKIAVLLGGTSAERDVSLVTGIAIARALAENGHEVQAIDCAYGDKRLDYLSVDVTRIIRADHSEIESSQDDLNRNIFTTIRYLEKAQVDVVFNALHGGYGENGQLPALLDLAGMAYTGSGSTASMLAMDKHLSKIMFREYGIPVANWAMLASPEELSQVSIDDLSLPLVVKPNAQGSTVGLSIVEAHSSLPEAVELAFRFSPTVMLEKFIPGRETTVAILGGEALPVLEIVINEGIYDYEAKYQGGRTEYLVPAPIPEPIAKAMQAASKTAYAALGCAGYARIDFRLQDDGDFFCLEANTLPGMTPLSLVPKAARAAGIDFNQLVEKIVDLAMTQKL